MSADGLAGFGGGGFFDTEFVDEDATEATLGVRVEACVRRDGGGGGGVAVLLASEVSTLDGASMLDWLTILSPSQSGGIILPLVPLAGGGSGFCLKLRILAGELPVIELACGLSTCTQSSSAPSLHGLLCRFGLSFISAVGGVIVLLAPLLPSSHHFLRSELAGGNPS